MIRVLILLLAMVTSAFAVEPDEILSDAELEARAREISKGLRCLVCRNESIDESHAELARDLRLLVRERLLAGDNDEEVIDFVVDRYGEYVLLNPRASGGNIILWLAGPIMFLTAGSIAFLYLRRRGQSNAPEELTDEEAARLREISET